MKQKGQWLLLAAGLAAAGLATAATKETPAQHKAKIEAFARSAKAFPQPETMAQAVDTRQTLDNGAVKVQVPTELFNTLSAETDAKGNVRIAETDGTTPAPAAKAEGPAHE